MAIYYISPTGNDANNGLSLAVPWQTIAKVNGSSFSPGDSILFQCGGTWRELLTVPSSGTNGNPIFFGKYSAGANPKVNGSALVNNANFSSYLVSGATVVNTTPTITVADGTTRNYRQEFTATLNSTTVQIKLTAAASANWVIAGTSIGPQVSQGQASSLTRITWNSGSNGVTITANGTATSDVLTFNLTAGTTYLVHVYMTARNLKQAPVTGPTLWTNVTASDQTLTLNPTFSASVNQQLLTQVIASDQTVYTLGASAQPKYSISSLTSSGTTATVTTAINHQLKSGQYVIISGATPSGYNGTYAITVTGANTFTFALGGSLASPATGTIIYNIPVYEVWENNSFLVQQSSIAACASWGSWYWDSSANVVYINPSDNSNPATSGKTYELPWLAYSIYDNQKSCLDISGIDCLQSYGSGDSSGSITATGISGIYLSGTNNVVHDLASYNHSRHSLTFYTSGSSCVGYNLILNNCSSTTPLAIYQSSGCTLRNSYLYNDNARCINGVIRIHGGSANHVIQDCEIYVGPNAKASPEIFFVGESGTTGNIIKRCYFHGYAVNGAQVGPLGGSDTFDFANNIIDWTNGTGHFLLFYNGISAFHIYNNTFYSPTSAVAGYFLFGQTNTTGSNVYVKNNIIVSKNILRFDVGCSAALATCDYNVYYSSGGSYQWLDSGTTYTGLSSWKAAFPAFDVNSLNVDPLLANPASNAFWLQSGSPCLFSGNSVDITTTGLYPGVAFTYSNVPYGAPTNPPIIGAYLSSDTGAALLC